MNNKNYTTEELSEILKNNIGNGIHSILNIAYDVLKNPIMMFDPCYKLIAHTENTITDDFLWNEITTIGTFSHETVDFFSKEKFIDDVANTEIITVLKSNKLKYNRVNAKIFNKDDIQIGNICVIACYTQLEEIDFKNIELICESLSRELEPSKEKVFEEAIIRDLIEENITDKDKTEEIMNNLYSGLKENIYIAVIDITKYEHTLSHLGYFRDLFKEMQGDFKYFVYLNNIVAIMSTDNLTLNVNKDLNKLYDFAKKYNIFIGISSSFQNLFEIKKYYKQALNALNYGINIDIYENERIFEYDNFRIDHFLNTVKNVSDIQELCHPVIFLIQEYDKNNDSSYFKTIRTYFSLGADIDLVSERLNISKSDLSKRLKDISDNFGIDLNNGNTRLSIFTSIKVLEYFLK